ALTFSEAETRLALWEVMRSKRRRVTPTFSGAFRGALGHRGRRGKTAMTRLCLALVLMAPAILLPLAFEGGLSGRCRRPCGDRFRGPAGPRVRGGRAAARR